jgi:hypothetical protein
MMKGFTLILGLVVSIMLIVSIFQGEKLDTIIWIGFCILIKLDLMGMKDD